mmetsp:Transcript_51613/g.167661  ORF Transcript_51613/g.167661 Transcript_51613/m.167661 type:complete len:84 (+) Transcript_51613:319-570(+)
MSNPRHPQELHQRAKVTTTKTSRKLKLRHLAKAPCTWGPAHETISVTSLAVPKRHHLVRPEAAIAAASHKGDAQPYASGRKRA